MNFLKQFFTRGNKVGAVARSSPRLVKAMLRPVDFQSAEVIVEFGAGTGAMTEEILKRLAPQATLIVFELNNAFMKYLKEEFDDPRVIWVHESAEVLPRILRDNGISSVDAVISSLPLTLIPDSTRMRIVSSARSSLRTGGHYVQFQYTLQAKRLLSQAFRAIRTRFVLWNIPPAFVYICTKLR